MNRIKITLKTLLVLCLLSSTLILSQTLNKVGNISGRVIDNSSGDPLIGVTVIHRLSGKYAISNIDGNYLLKDVPVGNQMIEFSMVSYQRTKLKVQVKVNKVIKSINVALRPPTNKTLVVTGRKISNTTAALLGKRQKAAAAKDAISAEQISRSPDSNAADAVKRITGVSIINGKYLYIRGLSERYSVVLINGSNIPSPIPTRKVVPLDVFPVILLDNMVVTKSYVANLPGAFGSGVIELNTKDYPDHETISVSLGVAYNSITTFKDFLSYKGGSLDFLGFDNGSRDMPLEATLNGGQKLFKANIISPNGFSQEQLRTIAKKFPMVWQPTNNTMNILGGQFQVSYGNTFKIGENNDLGILASLMYKEKPQNKNGHYKRLDPNKGTLPQDYEYQESSLLTTLTGQTSITWGYSKNGKVKLNSFYTHGSEDKARINSGRYSSADVGKKYILSFAESHLLFTQLAGSQYLGIFNGSKLLWNSAFSFAARSQPATRTTRYLGDGNIDPSNPFTSYYIKNNEKTYEANPALEIPFEQWNHLKSKITVGSGFLLRRRVSKTRRFKFDFVKNVSGFDLTQPAANLVNQLGLEVRETTGGSAGSGFDAYNGQLAIGSGFSLLELPLIRKVKMILGARIEKWQQRTEAFNQFQTIKANSISTINGTDVLPNTGLIYSPIKNVNFRFSFAQTINRPDFIEASDFEYFDDFERGALIQGNKNLTKADLKHYDIRAEWFPSSGEILSLSGFIKTIENPIESIVLPVAEDYFYSFANQKKADLIGAEIEIRKTLKFISNYIKDFSIMTNVTYTSSKIEIATTLDNSATNKSRQLQGLSPLIINTGLMYNNNNWGSNISLLYNMFSKRIINVGVNGLQDIFEDGYGKLDLTYGQEITENLKAKLTIANILDPKIQQLQDGIIVDQYNRGVNVSYSMNYSFH